MSSSEQQSRLWNPSQTLKLEEDASCTCIGYAVTKGRPCRNVIRYGDWRQAFYLLERLSVIDPKSREVNTSLKEIARLLLCKRWHGVPGGSSDQIPTVVRRWVRVIATVEVVVQESPTSATIEVTHSVATAPIRPRIAQPATPTIERRFNALPTPSPDPSPLIPEQSEQMDFSRRLERNTTPAGSQNSTHQIFGLPTPPSHEPAVPKRESFPIHDLPTPPSSQPRSNEPIAEPIPGDGSPIPRRTRRSLPAASEPNRPTATAPSIHEDSDGSSSTLVERQTTAIDLFSVTAHPINVIPASRPSLEEGHNGPTPEAPAISSGPPSPSSPSSSSSPSVEASTDRENEEPSIELETQPTREAQGERGIDSLHNPSAEVLTTDENDEPSIAQAIQPGFETEAPRNNDTSENPHAPSTTLQVLETYDPTFSFLPSSSENPSAPSIALQGLETYDPMFSFLPSSLPHSHAAAEQPTPTADDQIERNAAAGNAERDPDRQPPSTVSSLSDSSEGAFFGHAEIITRPAPTARRDHDLRHVHIDTAFIANGLSEVPIVRCNMVYGPGTETSQCRPVDGYVEKNAVGDNMADEERSKDRKSWFGRMWKRMTGGLERRLPCLGGSVGDA